MIWGKLKRAHHFAPIGGSKKLRVTNTTYTLYRYSHMYTVKHPHSHTHKDTLTQIVVCTDQSDIHTIPSPYSYTHTPTHILALTHR